MSKFFINRPIFAWVIAIIVCFIGVLSIFNMPVEQFPRIAPPTITVTATLPGASADTLEKTVNQVIEDKLTGLDNMRYFSSNSSSAGQVQITITFEPGTNADIAQVQVQNKIQQAIPFLPQAVKEQGVVVQKANNNFSMFVIMYSKNGATNGAKLGDLMASNVSPSLARISGVGNVSLFSSQYAMRIWLKPEKLYSYNISASEIISALQSQNTEIAAGELGGSLPVEGQQINATIKANSKLQTKEEFDNVIIKTLTDGSLVKLKDLADVELGPQSYATYTRYNKQPAAGLSITPEPNANSLLVASKVRERLEELKKTLPQDVELVVPYDTTKFVSLAIKSVIKTLIEAFILVFIVIFLFLQNFRATLIPSLAIPVVILGTFTVLNAFGFSVNTLTMFAMVLSIGLLVDDAIVVVENVERIMREEGLSPLEATKKSMEQIKGALIGIGVVLSSVFIPMAFLGGATGIIYKQFSITMVTSMALSVFVALIFSPALCVTLLKSHSEGGHSILTHNFIFNGINKIVAGGEKLFSSASVFVLSKFVRFFLIYIVMIGGVLYLFIKMPTSFLPDEDIGAIYAVTYGPSGSTIERTIKSVEQVEDYFLEKEKDTVKAIVTVPGFSFAGFGQNNSFGFVELKDWSERPSKEQSVFALSSRANAHFFKNIKDAFAITFFPPPIRELGSSSGFDLQLIDTKNAGHLALMGARNQLLFMASKVPYLSGVRPNGLEDVPQVKLYINYAKASALGVSFNAISSTLGTSFGASYVGDFLDNGKVKQIYVQGINTSRMLPSDIKKWFVKNNKGEMVPISSFVDFSWIYGSPKLERFNASPSVNVLGSAAPGISSGIAMKVVEKLAEKLPDGFEIKWQGVSYEEKQSGSQAIFTYAISILFVFLCLAALYESWSVPFAVILIVPFGFLGSLLMGKAFGLSNDVYFQISLLTIIGLSAKNAILIVEFAKEMYEEGHGLLESTFKAMEQRFRPIIMTSLAFVLGVIPLALASGAGSNSQNVIGISIIGGMVFATFVAPIFVPLFYVSILRLTKKK